MILLSAHKDTVMHPYRIEYKNGQYVGLLDNWIGVFIVNALLFDDPNIALLEKRDDIQIFMGDSEEWGTITPLPKIKKEDIVLVVDMETGHHYDKIDMAFVNIAGFSKQEIKDLQEHLLWEGIKTEARFFDGDPENEDESWKWREQGAKVISIVIPCQDAGKTGWHVDNCTISYEKVRIVKYGIKRLLNYLVS